MGKNNGFLLSSAWAKIKVDLLMVRGQKCESCGRENSATFHIHHLCYDRYGGNEEPGDLIILCPPCHMKEHGIKTKKQIAKDKARKRKDQRKAQKKAKAKKKKTPAFTISSGKNWRGSMTIEQLRARSNAMDIKPS